jgi:hypothetical protein
MFSNLHIYKTNSILQIVVTGVELSDSDVYVEHHNALILLTLIRCSLRVLRL